MALLKKSWILIALVIGLRSYHEACFLQMDSDYGVQLEAAKNFLDGNGLSNAVVDPANLNHVSFVPLEKWPVFYPLLLAGLKWISGSWFFAVWLSQIGSMLLLFFASVRVLKKLRIGESTIFLFYLFFAISAAFPYYLAATDTLTTALFLYCIPLALEEKTGWKSILLISVLSMLNALIRFACIPNLLIIPGYFLLLWMFSKKGSYFITGSMVGLISIGFTLVFYYFFPIASGRTGFVSNLVSGNLFWEHLKWFDAFPIKSLFYLSPIEYRLPGSTPGLIPFYRIALLLLSGILVGVIFWKFIRVDRLWNAWMKDSPQNDQHLSKLFLLFVSASAIIIGFLTLQSVATAPENNSFGPHWMPPMWTFVYAHRYFSFLTAFILLFFFVAMERGAGTKFGTAFKGITYTSMLYSFLFFAYTQFQIYSPKGNGGGTFWSNEKNELAILSAVTKGQTWENRIVYAAHDLGENAPVVLLGPCHPVRNYEALLHNRLIADPGTVLFMKIPILNLDSSTTYFIENEHLKKVLTFENEVLYRKDF